jgi:NAD(P)-dependent dehydrogenase (short-subunit alcohol dehydrogenase family)
VKPVLLITGASRGIGAATAVLAAQKGWAVAVNYASNASAANGVVQQIQDAGGTAIAVQADVGDEAQILRMFAEVDAKLGRLSGLVNNAGVVDVTARVQDQSWARWERMMRINVLGSFACAREAVKRMSTTHGGSGGSISTCRVPLHALAHLVNTWTTPQPKARLMPSRLAWPKRWPPRAFASTPCALV